MNFLFLSLMLLTMMISIHGWHFISAEGSKRRQFLAIAFAAPAAYRILPISTANAYTPDPDPQQEALYLLSRVQEATCLQERYIGRSRPPLAKMKQTLRLVDRSYRLLDQVTLLSKSITDSNSLVLATQYGNEAAERLQEAMDYVNVAALKYSDSNPMDDEQRQFIVNALVDTRQGIFDFEGLLPLAEKVQRARQRVEDENKLNRDEFDPDLANETTGVYNPIVLPWKSS